MLHWFLSTSGLWCPKDTEREGLGPCSSFLQGGYLLAGVGATESCPAGLWRPAGRGRQHMGEKLILGIILLRTVRVTSIMLLGKVNPPTRAPGSFSQTRTLVLSLPSNMVNFSLHMDHFYQQANILCTRLCSPLQRHFPLPPVPHLQTLRAVPVTVGCLTVGSN